MICLLHKYEPIGIFYEEYKPECYNYGCRIFEVYRCNKCGKETHKNIDNLKYVYHSIYIERLNNIRNKGIKDIVEYKLNKING